MDTIPVSTPKPIDQIDGGEIVVGDENESKSRVQILSKNVYKFVIYNTEMKRDDTFEFQETFLPKDTPEQTYQRAKLKAMGFIKTRECYAGQKLRNPGEPR